MTDRGEVTMKNWARARIVPLTRKAKKALSAPEVPVDEFPFRIGRECRIRFKRRRIIFDERRTGTMAPNNDLYLINIGKSLQISREHLQIEKCGTDSYQVVDRGSACGTIVDGCEVGGKDRSGTHPLKHGSTVTLGDASSPFTFRFELSGN
jgi:pSer/pThr/pTyr-binding forkhead associated (FHA) protein